MGMVAELHHQRLQMNGRDRGTLGQDLWPKKGPSHPYPLSGPWQITWHPDVYISRGPFNPLHFGEVETEAQRSEVTCLRSHSKVEVRLELEL